jgi:MerR family transcriptional regulator, light-induced transcriptional regulator
VAGESEYGSHRIGTFARRVGVTPELLRAWERRYGLLQPIRSQGGFRLYTEADAERVTRMRGALDEGLSAAEAARVALAPVRPAEGLLADALARLLDAIARYDEAAVHAVLDENLAAFGIEAVLRELILPALSEIGARWQTDERGISQEHFASNLIRGRLLALARLWGRGSGPLALLACVPGEQHDLSLIAFGLLLRSHGWRILFLGANTPIATVARTAEETHPALAVLTSFDPELLESQAAAVRRFARIAPLALAGPGASEELCRKLRVRRLNGDVVAAAGEVARAPLTSV